MADAKTITIVGGGLAGLTLGIGLRRQDVPVSLHEAGAYPRHRVCGEFISGRGQATLDRLGLQEWCGHTGAVAAQTAAFYSSNNGTPPRPLPSPATCVSRYALDAALAAEFSRLGGTLLSGRRRREDDFGEGIVRATGRTANRRSTGERWFGLKVHARNVRPAADLEMHFSPEGYVGLCQLNGGEVNICGLFRKRANDGGTAQNGREWLRGRPGTILNERLAMAEFDEASFCAVAGLSLQPKRASEHGEICIGDAITMIPPVTGNGMSMAFESAELAIAPLTSWSRGESSWTAARAQIASVCDAAFRRRLAWAKWLQRLVLTPSLQSPLVMLAARSDRFWRMAFERTR